MNHYTIRIYLFKYNGTYKIHKCLKLFWLRMVAGGDLLKHVQSAKQYCDEQVRSYECDNYHIVTGKD